MSASNVVLNALAKAFDKAASREGLVEGSKHRVSALVVGHVDESVPFNFTVDTELCLGHATTTKSTAPIDPKAQLAYVLEAVELAFGEDAVIEILDDIRSKFIETKTIPTTGKFIDLVDKLDKDLRAEKILNRAATMTVKTTVAPEPRFIQAS